VSEAPARKTYTHRVRVGYVDTDLAGVVHHSTYLRYLEAARVEFLRHHGVDFRLLEQEGHLAMPVVEVELRYKLPAHFDDQLGLETWVGRLTRARLRFDTHIWCEGKLLTEAQIMLCCIDMATGRPRVLPDMIHSACV